MATPTYDLVRGNYDLSKPLQAARFQATCRQFMEGVRNNAFQDSKGEQLMDEFCTFVNSKHVWGLAQNVVPEFRSAPGPSTGEASQSCLAHVLRQLPLIPPPRDDTNVLTSEQKMLLDRHRAYLEYLVTGGRGKDTASPNDLLEIESLSQQYRDAQEAVAGKGAEDGGPMEE